MKKILSSRLKTLRGARTQAEISKILGIKQQVWARYERGITVPGADFLHHICCKLDASADWLLGLSDHKPFPSRASQKLDALKKAITELLKEY